MTEPRECCWPGCRTLVPASMWGCRKHWFMLPKSIRDRLWAAYRPGQEEDRQTSDRYDAAFADARAFAINAEGGGL